MAYDRVEWHAEAAREAGGTEAFAHAELYLRWLTSRDVLAEMPDEPGVLSAAALTDEGRHFTDAYYARYLDDFGAVFADVGAYRVQPDDDTFDRIARVIDQRYAEWVYAGRPELPPEEDPGDQLAALLEATDLPPELTEEAVRSMSPDEIVAALEQLIARGRRAR